MEKEKRGTIPSRPNSQGKTGGWHKLMVEGKAIKVSTKKKPEVSKAGHFSFWAEARDFGPGKNRRLRPEGEKKGPQIRPVRFQKQNAVFFNFFPHDFGKTPEIYPASFVFFPLFGGGGGGGGGGGKLFFYLVAFFGWGGPWPGGSNRIFFFPGHRKKCSTWGGHPRGGGFFGVAEMNWKNPKRILLLWGTKKRVRGGAGGYGRGGKRLA